MATRGELTSYVLERLGVSSGRSTFVSKVQSQLFREYVAAARELELSRDVADLVFVANDPFVDLPDDWLKTRTIRLSGSATPLREVTMEVLAGIRGNADVNSVVGAPISRYIFMPPSRIYLESAPEANDAAGAELFYVVKPAVWDDDADTPDFMPEEYHDYLAEMVVYRMAQDQEDMGMAQGALSAAGQIRQRLILEMKLRTGDPSHHITRRHYG